MKKYLPLVVYWLVNSFIVYLVFCLYPNSVVLGNGWLGSFFSALVTGLFIVVIDRLAKHINKLLLHFKNRFRMFGLYLAANVIGFWVLARIPSITGYGITRFTWAIVLGVVTTLVQWVVRQGLKAGKLV
jgi:uncharacterized membrane protein YvlD (DUF360 family)